MKDFGQGTARAQGKIGYPKPLEKFGSLTGAPVVEKFVGYAPIEDIGRCKDCAKLFVIAEKLSTASAERSRGVTFTATPVVW